MDIPRQYTEASIKTADNLKTIARSVVARDLSRLTLPEIDAVVDLVAISRAWEPGPLGKYFHLSGICSPRSRRMRLRQDFLVKSHPSTTARDSAGLRSGCFPFFVEH